MNKKSIFSIILVVIILAIVAGFAWQRYMIKTPITKTKIFQVGLLQFAPIVSQNIDGFKIGMDERGYKEGVNINYIYRDAQGNLDLLKQYATELVALKPDMIFVNTSPATKLIKELTAFTSIPVVFSMVADPVLAKFVNSMENSGNNMTGTSCAYIDIAPKRLEVLKNAAPNVKRVMVFYRPADLSGGACAEKIKAKAPELGIEIVDAPITKKEDIEEYLKKLKPGEIDAVMDAGDSMVTSALDIIVSYSKALKIPYMALSRGEVEKGATLGYAVDYIDLGKQSSLIANQVLSGINPTDIPVEKPRKWFFTVNQLSAKEIGLEIPEDLMQQADFVVNK